MVKRASNGRFVRGGGRRRSYSRSKRTYSRRQKKIPVAIVIGAAGSGVSMYRNVKASMGYGYTLGQALTTHLTGYNPRVPEDNTAQAILGRIADNYGPAVGGLVVHEVVGNPKGAFGTGLGLKLNGKLNMGRLSI